MPSILKAYLISSYNTDGLLETKLEQNDLFYRVRNQTHDLQADTSRELEKQFLHWVFRHHCKPLM